MRYTVPLTGAAPICAGVIRAVKVTEVLVLTGFTVSWSVAEEMA